MTVNIKTLIITLLMAFYLLSARGGAPAHAFGAPEKLIYDLTWTGIKAGTAIQEVIKEPNGVKIVSTARSADWITTFFPVEDRVETILNLAEPPVMGKPQNFRMKIREGNHRRDKEIIFDQKHLKANFINHLNKDRAEVPITDKTFDTYSSFFYVRTLKLEVGKSVFLDIIDDKQIYHTEVQVLRKEKISTVLGDFDTIVIKPVLKSEGIFSKKGELLIWLTDDEKKIPVKMKTKVTIGSITATLVGGNY